MTTRYRVEYALKTHRRDQFIEWIKGLLAVPFVLSSQPTTAYEDPSRNSNGDVTAMAANAARRYTEIMRDIEVLIEDHIVHQQRSQADRSKLKHLVPTIGSFFTPLALHDAFLLQDARRFISSRRFVAPSFNDVRLVLNTAQVLSLTRGTRMGKGIDLITFDGDVTLYDDGESLTEDNPVIQRIVELLRRRIKVGIVTAAGYTDASKYYARLYGLLDAMSVALPEQLQSRESDLVVMGGESNYLFRYDGGSTHKLKEVTREEWALEEMRNWTQESIDELLQVAETALRDCVQTMNLDAQVIRKERAVGIIPRSGRLAREQLEETVLVTQKRLEVSDIGRRIPFCAFNGGNDVFVDIGDKSWGVSVCQKFFGGIEGARTLHVGDQFLSAGANDFKARQACTTAWIASPAETIQLLDEILESSKS